ncbi:MAG: hypothetical protein GY909_04630 [Oligoflexia bacterium]|nr:hypothetical protein [Oligoflexia bacterium]
MKLMGALLLAFSFTFNVMACDTYEAQVIAKIEKVETDSMTYCTAKFTVDSFKMFNEHQLCPLSLGYVLQNGVEFNLENGHDCEITNGEVITGYLYTKNGKVYLD